MEARNSGNGKERTDHEDQDGSVVIVSKKIQVPDSAGRDIRHHRFSFRPSNRTDDWITGECIVDLIFSPSK